MGRIRIVGEWSDYLELSQFSYNFYPYPTIPIHPYSESPNKGYQSCRSWDDQIHCNSSSFNGVLFQRRRSFSMVCQAPWILCSRQHTITSHGFHCLLLHGRRSVGMVPRCRGPEASGLCINWAHFICALQDRFWAPILDASMETTTQESKMQEPMNFMRRTKNQFLMHQSRLSLKSPRFKNR